MARHNTRRRGLRRVSRQRHTYRFYFGGGPDVAAAVERDITAIVDKELAGTAKKIKAAEISVAELDAVEDRIASAVEVAAETRTDATAAAAMNTVAKLAHDHEDAADDVYKAAGDAGDMILAAQTSGIRESARVAAKIQVNTLAAIGSIRDKVKGMAYARITEMQKAITKLGTAMAKSADADLKAGRVGAAGDDADGRAEDGSAVLDLINVYRLEIANCRKIIIDADRSFPGSADAINEAISADQRAKRKNYAQWAVIAMRALIVSARDSVFNALGNAVFGFLVSGNVFSGISKARMSIAAYLKLSSPMVGAAVANSGVIGNTIIGVAAVSGAYATMKVKEEIMSGGGGGGIADNTAVVCDNITLLFESPSVVDLAQKVAAADLAVEGFVDMASSTTTYIKAVSPFMIAVGIAISVASNTYSAATASRGRINTIRDAVEHASTTIRVLASKLAENLVGELFSLSPADRRNTAIVDKITSRLTNQADIACSVFEDIANKQTDDVTLSVTSLASSLDNAACIASNAIAGSALKHAVDEMARTVSAIRRSMPVLARGIGTLFDAKYTELVDAALESAATPTPCKLTKGKVGGRGGRGKRAPTISAGETMAQAEDTIASLTKHAATPATAPVVVDIAVKSAVAIKNVMMRMVREHGFKGGAI